MTFAVHDRFKTGETGPTVCVENADGTCWPILEAIGDHTTPDLMTEIDALVERANAWQEATLAERERCAKVAEEWRDPLSAYEGCAVSYGEGQWCSAPSGIAADIRSGK